MRRPSLAELASRYVVEARPLPAALEAELRADPRAGARRILEAVERRRRRNRAEGQRLRILTQFEAPLWKQGVTLVAGIDEAGMSPLAGPVVAAAVILPVGWRLAGLDDSKKLDAPRRSAFARIIERECVSFGVGFAEPEEIDRINVYWAGLLAMRRALDQLAPRPQHLLIDARRLDEVALPQACIIRGDEKSVSIAAASVIAKTTRDAHMAELDREYPGYGFSGHKGYPVRQHREALLRLGPSQVHRRSFALVREACERAGVTRLARAAARLGEVAAARSRLRAT
jgi:ribonuclease HII